MKSNAQSVLTVLFLMIAGSVLVINHGTPLTLQGNARNAKNNGKTRNVQIAIASPRLDAFVQLQFENGRSVLGNLVNDFFGTMLKDEDFRCDLTIFERLVNRIKNQII